MSSNTNIGNTPVNQGYVQLIHTGETGGIDGTLRTLYDGDGTASDLQIASNKVKISTQLYIGSKTIAEYVQDVVGDMLDTNGSHTNITATYDDDGDGAIDLVATGAISSITGGTGIDATGSGDITIAIDSTVATKTYVDTEVAGLVDSAPGTLDTLNELAAALGDDPNFATTTANNIATKLAITSNLSDLNNVATARTNLGVDVAGTDNSTDVTLVTTSHDYLSLSGQAITLGTIDISDDTNLVGGTGITLTGDTLSTTDSEIVHDNLSGFVSNEHKDHSAININTAAGSGLTGGGDITTTRSIGVDVNNLDAQVPALELADKIAIYDNSATETNVATLTQLKAIVNTDTDTNQLTTFDVSGDSGTDQTISHGNTLTISGGNGISTSTSATDILSVALGGFSALTLESSPAEQDLLVLEDEIDGTIKKVQVGALTSGISFNGSTANGLLTFGNSTTADVESNLTFDGTNLAIAATGKLYLDGGSDTYIHEASAGIYELRVNNLDVMSADMNAGANVVFNDQQLDIDFRIESNNASHTFFVDAGTDRVGIGTSSPAGKLEIKHTSATISDPHIAFEGSGGETDDFAIYAPSGENTLRFGYSGSGEDTDILTIQRDSATSGSVGIGTTSPTYELDVAGDIGVDHLITHNSDSNTYVQFTNDRLRFAAGGEVLLDLYEGTQDYVKLGDGGDVDINLNDDMFVEGSSGNVGIGTTSPGHKVHIDSNGSTNSVLRIDADDARGANRYALDVQDDDGNRRGTARFRHTTGSGNPPIIISEGYDHAYIFQSKNTSASDAEQFRIEHFDGNVRINSLRGTLALQNTGGGNIGVGTTVPGALFTVKKDGTQASSVSTTYQINTVSASNGGIAITAGASSTAYLVFGDSGDYDAGRIGYKNASHELCFFTNNAEEMVLDSDGDLHVDRDVVAFSTTPSDRRLKTNIQDINYGLETIMKLNPKQYDWKKDNAHDIGFIAQEVEEVIPEIVKDKKHFDKEIKTLDYEKLTAVLIKAVQEQQQQINKLEEKLNG